MEDSLTLDEMCYINVAISFYADIAAEWISYDEYQEYKIRNEQIRKKLAKLIVKDVFDEKDILSKDLSDDEYVEPELEWWEEAEIAAGAH